MPRKAKRRPHLVAFGGVVVDHIEEHLDSCRVQHLHHGLEFADAPGRRVAHVGREEAERVVAPVVVQAFLDQVPVVDKVMHRHQLDGRDAQAHQMIHDRGGRESGVGAAQMGRHVRVADGESAHVRLVDHRVVPRNVRWAVVAPGEGRIDDAALWGTGGTVTPVEGQILPGVARAVAEVCIAPYAAAPAACFTYGSIRSLCGLKRWPFSGA